MKNKIGDLRDHLFETLEMLKDKDNPMDIERAKAISGVAQVIVDSAKVENEYLKISGDLGTGFVNEPKRVEGTPHPFPLPKLEKKK